MGEHTRVKAMHGSKHAEFYSLPVTFPVPATYLRSCVTLISLFLLPTQGPIPCCPLESMAPAVLQPSLICPSMQELEQEHMQQHKQEHAQEHT